MANRWGKVETVTNFIFLGSKITADSGNHEIKIQLLLRRKTMTNLDSMLKSRYITLPTKVCIIKFVVFPVVMYGCESAKKIDAFKLWCWRLLRVSWMARRSNLSILKEINTEYSLERLMLKLKLQYSGHLMQRAESLEKTLMLGKTEKGATEDEMFGWHHQFNGHVSANSGRWRTGRPSGCKELDRTEQQQSFHSGSVLIIHMILSKLLKHLNPSQGLITWINSLV